MGVNLKRIMLIGLSFFLILTGLINISCKKDSKGTKTTKKLDDSTFVELAARQNLLIKKYHYKLQQVKSDSDNVLLSSEFKKETDEILSEHGISREQLKNYVEEMLKDTQKIQELQGKIINRMKELIAEASKPEEQ